MRIINSCIKNGLIIFISILLLLFVSCPYKDYSVESRVDKCIKDYINKYNYQPAISVSVYSQSKGIDLNYTYGMASIPSKIKNNSSTPHYLYSITKSFVAGSIIKLIKAGELSFDDPISKFSFDFDQVYINNDATIEELLTHRSGIQDYTDSPSIINNNPFSNNEIWNPETILYFIEKPAQNRGSFLYSSSNYIILAMIVEKITNQTLNNYIKDNFLDGLDISLSLYPQDDVDLSLLARPHSYPYTFMGLVGDGKTPIDITTIIPNALDLLGKCSWAAGGMIGSANDVAKWGYELLSENSNNFQEIRSEIYSSILDFSSDKALEAYGYGVRKLFYNGYEFLGSYGRSIGDENLMFYNKDKDVCITILSSSNMKNDNTPNIDELMYAIFDSL